MSAVDAVTLSRPLSCSVLVLNKYCGGLMQVWDANGHKYWALLESVDKYTGIFVKGYRCQEGRHSVVWPEVSFAVAGVMSVVRGGPLKIFGIIAEDEDGNLQQAYTPCDSHGHEISGATPLINVFYLPGSLSVPQEIRELFASQ
jgi:hypothetical protein